MKKTLMIVCGIAVLSAFIAVKNNESNKEGGIKSAVANVIKNNIDSIAVVDINISGNSGGGWPVSMNGLILDKRGLIALPFMLRNIPKSVKVYVPGIDDQLEAMTLAYDNEYAILFVKIKKSELEEKDVELKPFSFPKQVKPLQIGDVIFELGKGTANVNFTPYIRFDIISMVTETPIESYISNFNGNVGRPIYSSDGSLVGIRMVHRSLAGVAVILKPEILLNLYEQIKDTEIKEDDPEYEEESTEEEPVEEEDPEEGKDF